jgi:hypothetical protein
MLEHTLPIRYPYDVVGCQHASRPPTGWWRVAWSTNLGPGGLREGCEFGPNGFGAILMLTGATPV